MVVYRDVFQPLAVFRKFKPFSLTFSFHVACSVIFSQYSNLHHSYVNCFIDSFNCKRDASSVLIEYCPESCIWKVKYLYINGTWNSLLIHGFSLVNARLLKACGTAFYAIIKSLTLFIHSIQEAQTNTETPIFLKSTRICIEWWGKC